MVDGKRRPHTPAREYPTEEREIRFFFDYGHPWPLWENYTDEYALTPEDYGLSPELVTLLGRCCALWECMDFDGRFDPPEAEAQFEEEACREAVEKRARRSSTESRSNGTERVLPPAPYFATIDAAPRSATSAHYSTNTTGPDRPAWLASAQPDQTTTCPGIRGRPQPIPNDSTDAHSHQATERVTINDPAKRGGDPPSRNCRTRLT